MRASSQNDAVTGTKPLRLLIVDDHEVVREGLMAALSNDNRFTLVGGASSADQAVEIARQERPDVAIVDMHLPDLPGHELFTWMRPNDLVWNYWVNNYLMGKNPPAFDILAWNADKTNLPARLHSQFLDIFEGNLLAKPGGLTVLGSQVNLSAIKVDTYVTGGLTDHLTPWQGCYRATQLLSGESTFVLSPTGHIQTQVSPPGNPKAHYFVGSEPGPDPDAWRATAERRDGSWWEHWCDWIIERGGGERRAPKQLGSKRHPVLDPAPGRYVLEPA